MQFKRISHSLLQKLVLHFTSTLLWALELESLLLNSLGGGNISQTAPSWIFTQRSKPFACLNSKSLKKVLENVLNIEFADGTPSFRDFRVTTNPTILEEFVKDLALVQNRLLLASDYRGATSPGAGSKAPTVGSTSAGSNGGLGGLPGNSLKPETSSGVRWDNIDKLVGFLSLITCFF